MTLWTFLFLAMVNSPEMARGALTTLDLSPAKLRQVLSSGPLDVFRLLFYPQYLMRNPNHPIEGMAVFLG